MFWKTIRQDRMPDIFFSNLPKKEFTNDLELVNIQFWIRHGPRAPLMNTLSLGPIWAKKSKSHYGFDIVNQKECGNFLERTIRYNPSVPAEHIDTHPGELIAEGVVLHRNLGRRILQEYKKVGIDLSKDIRNAEFRTSMVQRTLESLYGFLQGIFPPIRPKDEFKIISYVPNCENAVRTPSHISITKEMLKAYRSSISFAAQSQELSFIKQCMEKCNSDVDYRKAYDLVSSLYAVKYPGVSGPNDIDTRYLESKSVSEVFGPHLFFDSLYIRSIANGLLNDQLSFFKRIIDQKAPKLQFNVLHDLTLANLLLSYGVFDHRWPVFGSSVIFETFKRDGKYLARMRYNGKSLHVPGCPEDLQNLCPLDDFLKNVSKIVEDAKQDNISELKDKLKKTIVMNEIAPK